MDADAVASGRTAFEWNKALSSETTQTHPQTHLGNNWTWAAGVSEGVSE